MAANDSTPDGIRLFQVVSRSGVVVTERKKGSLSSLITNGLFCTIVLLFH